MISVQEALDKIFALLEPLDAESIELRKASGRVLAEAVIASRAQPPFSASVMDGYAVATADVYAGDTFSVIGEAAAGSRFEGRVETGQAVRIFTGAPAPDGAQRVLIQEDVSRDADTIQVKENADSSLYIRDAGADFAEGAEIPAGRKLTTADIALAAAMNTPTVRAFRQPIVALIPTGDELVMPGEDPTDDQIIASNIFGLAAMLESEGAIVRILPIARDNEAALSAVFDLAKGADLVVTIGGASVGDHDLVGTVAADRGMERSFSNMA
ncbi:MAG: molybdopterin molybdotransferase MoeA, partial [Boseongicola sp.]|nr:molybdopterin molybdotransferase MoeA [Boseongicola sp.]